jgi:tripartite-type tricarboxylate transporter receptor subunit TctC
MPFQTYFFKRIAVALASGFFCISTFAGEVCPATTIKMVVPNPPGGTGDLVARLLSEKAGSDLGQTIVVENHAGATTTIGTNLVVRSRPDGCTILSMTTSGLIISVLREKLPYDLSKDLSPVLSVGSFPMVIAVPASSKIQSLTDLIAVTRSRDGVVYGTGGTGTLAHLSTARLIKELDGSGTHIAFRGNSDAMQALLGQQIQVFLPSTAEAIPLVKAGKIRLLGVTSDERLSSLPDTPTMKELGFPDFSPRLWYGFLVPSGTQPTTIGQLRSSFNKALMDTQVQNRLSLLGFSTEFKDSSQFSAYMKAEATRWTKVIKENRITSTD